MQIGYVYQLKAYPPRGGNHRHAFELVQHFKDLGHRVHVLDDPTMPNSVNHGRQEVDSFLRQVDLLYVRVDGRRLRNSPVIRHLMRHAAVPIVWEINAPANEALAFSWLGGKRSHACTETLARRARRRLHATRQMPAICLEEQFRRRLAAKVDAAICVSDALANYAQQHLGIPRVKTLPNAGPLISETEIEARRAGRRARNFTVLYSGSAIYPWQGLQYLHDTVVMAQRAAPDIRFRLLVNQESENLPRGSNVSVETGLSQEAVRDATCQADLCLALHPDYFWSKWGFHGSPMKLFEYMGCMSASLTSTVGQMPTLTRDQQDAFLCDNNAPSILSRILECKAKPHLRQQVARNGWERIQRELNWPRNARETVALFETVLAESPWPTRLTRNLQAGT